MQQITNEVKQSSSSSLSLAWLSAVPACNIISLYHYVSDVHNFAIISTSVHIFEAFVLSDSYSLCSLLKVLDSEEAMALFSLLLQLLVINACLINGNYQTLNREPIVFNNSSFISSC